MEEERMVRRVCYMPPDEEKRFTINVEEGTVKGHLISTDSLDRGDDIVESSGWDFKDFMKNPMVLADHSYSIKSVIGKSLGVKSSSHTVRADTQFDLSRDIGIESFGLVKSGFVKSWSVGFRPNKSHSLTQGSREKCPQCKSALKAIRKRRGLSDDDDLWTWGRHHMEQPLHEYSLVAIPMNQDVVMSMIKSGAVSEENAYFLFRPDNVEYFEDLVGGMQMQMHEMHGFRDDVLRAMSDLTKSKPPEHINVELPAMQSAAVTEFFEKHADAIRNAVMKGVENDTQPKSVTVKSEPVDKPESTGETAAIEPNAEDETKATQTEKQISVDRRGRLETLEQVLAVVGKRSRAAKVNTALSIARGKSYG